jgi:hypothetical protein
MSWTLAGAMLVSIEAAASLHLGNFRYLYCGARKEFELRDD